jgi:hypothetical protein
VYLGGCKEEGCGGVDIWVPGKKSKKYQKYCRIEKDEEYLREIKVN